MLHTYTRPVLFTNIIRLITSFFFASVNFLFPIYNILYVAVV